VAFNFVKDDLFCTCSSLRLLGLNKTFVMFSSSCSKVLGAVQGTERETREIIFPLLPRLLMP